MCYKVHLLSAKYLPKTPQKPHKNLVGKNPAKIFYDFLNKKPAKNFKYIQKLPNFTKPK